MNTKQNTVSTNAELLPQPKKNMIASANGWDVRQKIAYFEMCKSVRKHIRHDVKKYNVETTKELDGLVECDQPGKNPLKYSTITGN